jgi:nucleoside-diphosphate-sugar epimerase
MLKTKILVVGGCGYIGGYMVEALASNYRHDVTVYDNLTYENHYLKPVNFIFGDVRDTEKLSKIINDYDIVIWLAAIVGDAACTVDKNLTYDVNFKSVKWLVDNFKGKIVFTSTCSVYGKNDNLLDEESEVNPLSLYAETKLLAEQYILNNCKDYLIFRLGTLFGVGDEFSRIRFDLVVNILTLKATKGEVLTVNGGSQWRPLLHVKDVSNAVIYGIKNNITGLFNLSAINSKISEIAENIKYVIDNTIIEYKDCSFEDARNYKVITSKFDALNWKPSFTLSHGINQIKEVIEQQRIKNPYNNIYNNYGFLNEIGKK